MLMVDPSQHFRTGPHKKGENVGLSYYELHFLEIPGKLVSQVVDAPYEARPRLPFRSNSLWLGLRRHYGSRAELLS